MSKLCHFYQNCVIIQDPKSEAQIFEGKNLNDHFTPQKRKLTPLFL